MGYDSCDGGTKMNVARDKDGKPRWHYFYFLLAAFDLLTVALSLGLTHRMMTIHESAVEKSQQWASKVNGLSILAVAAQKVNAPGNDVFDSRDPVSERARLEKASRHFDQSLTGVAADLTRGTTPVVARTFHDDVARIRSSMAGMKAEADTIFGAFEKGDGATAGARMASMDRSYAQLTNAIALTTAHAQQEQQTFLQRHLVAAQEMRRYEYLIVTAVILMVLGVILFGHRIGSTVNAQHLDKVARKVAEDHLEEQSRLRAIAEEANQAKSVFLANMSHELRTPLNAIIGYSEMVIEDLVADDADHCSKPDMDRVVGSAKHLLALINDILYLSKVEAGHVDIKSEPLVVEELIQDVIGIAAPLARKSGIPLETRIDRIGTIRSDAQKIKQCLLNLISNACKFTSEGSITVSAERVSLADGSVGIRFCIADTGIGMTEDQVERIFNPFQQADSSIEQRFGGTGLGLSITRELARMLGGDVTVTSEKGVGTQVQITIAADLMVAGEAEDELEPLVGDPSKPLVLVIEDEIDARELVTRALLPVGFAVQCATTARAGFRAVSTRLPSLIVLDICLPDASGWAFLDQIKRDKVLGNIPVVVLSVDDDRVRSLALGAAEHIVKPVHRDVLAATAARLARAPLGAERVEQRDAA